MMNVYLCTIKTNYHGREMGKWSYTVLKDEAAAENYVTDINWNNLAEHWKRFGDTLPFNIYTRKKGRVIEWHSPAIKDLIKDWRCRNVKEWERHDMSITVTVNYKPTEVSLSQVLDFPNGADAILYLTQRGLTVKI